MSNTGHDTPSTAGGDWFASAFGERYLELYAHRDRGGSEALLDAVFDPDELRGVRVLDLACGAGRYLSELASRGAWGIGLDLSLPLLTRAARGPAASPLVRADMRAIPFRAGSFEWTLSMFTSFGYFSSASEHAGLAQEIARVTRTGVVVDVPNPQVLEATLVPHSRREVQAGIVEEQRWIDPAPRRVRKSIRLLSRHDGSLLEQYEERVTLFTLEELAALFAPVGLQVARVRGGYDGSQYEPAHSERILVRLQRSGSAAGGLGR